MIILIQYHSLSPSLEHPKGTVPISRELSANWCYDPLQTEHENEMTRY